MNVHILRARLYICFCGVDQGEPFLPVSTVSSSLSFFRLCLCLPVFACTPMILLLRCSHGFGIASPSDAIERQREVGGCEAQGKERHRERKQEREVELCIRRVLPLIKLICMDAAFTCIASSTSFSFRPLFLPSFLLCSSLSLSLSLCFHSVYPFIPFARKRSRESMGERGSIPSCLPIYPSCMYLTVGL